MSYFSEHRLIHRTLQDFGQAAKLNREQQAKQIEYQNQTHQQALAQNQSDAALKMAAPKTDANPLGGQAQGANYYQTQGDKLAVQNPVANQYDQVALPQGGIDQAAYDRLIKAGKTPQAALAEINNKTDVQGAFNEVGTTGDFKGSQAALERMNDRTSTANPNRIDPNTVGNGDNMTPVDRAAARSSAATINAARAQEEYYDRQAANETADRNATASAASSAASGKTAAPPDTSALDTALSALGPEGQLIGEALKASLGAAVQEELAAAKNLGIELTQAEASKAAYDKLLDTQAAESKAIQEKVDSFITSQQQKREETIAKQQESTQAQLKFQEGQMVREARYKLDKQINQMVTAQALGGGFGSSNWTAEVADAEWRGEQAISDLKKEFGFKRADVDIAFTDQLNNIYEFYGNQKLQALKDYRSEKQQIDQYRFSATEKTEERKANAQKTFNSTLAGIAKEQATRIDKATTDVLAQMKVAKQEKIDAEDRALSHITTLLNDFPESEVRDMVLELGKNVTSFSVEAMLNAKSKDEIKAAQNAAAARQRANAMLLAQKAKDAPIITRDEFINQKIAEKEQELGQSMSESSRQEYLNVNQSYFESQFDQLVSPNFQNITSGDPYLDSATDAYIRGDLTIAAAAKAFGVTQAEVATHAGTLRKRGAEVGDIRALQPEQAKELATLRKTIDEDDVTKKLNVMDTAIPKIGVARSSLTGVGDVALLNFYQNGIVDPGLAVRAEDATLLRKASALRDKITTQFAEEVLLEGAFFPDETRAEMEKIAKQVQEATQRVYQEKVYAPIVEQAALSGISEPYFKYKKRQPVEAQDTPADSYISTFGR